MLSKRIPLFRIFGFHVGIDLTWLLLAFFLSWSLAKGLFPHYFEGLSNSTYWWMGIAGALGLFGSVVFHELCHSLVARRFGTEMKGITLFLFGGVAEMPEEPPTPKSEFLMALAGPTSSYVLGGVLFLVYALGAQLGWSTPVQGVVQYLMWLNIILATFNLVPAFPLDGGRLLRSILWSIKGDLRWATRIASFCGSVFGMVLIVLGILAFIGGNVVGGVWYFLIGMFVRSAAQLSYSRMVMRGVFRGETVDRFMHPDPVVVPPSVSLGQVVEEYFYRYHHKLFPVADNGRLLGCLTAEQVRRVPREQWDHTNVQAVAETCSDENTIDVQADAMDALGKMRAKGRSRLLVTRGENLVGILTLRDLLDFLAVKTDLEQGESAVKMPAVQTTPARQS